MKTLNIGILALISLLIFACNPAKDNLLKNIKELEAEVNQQASGQSVVNLLSKYNEFINNHSDDAENCGRFLYRSAGLAYRVSDYKKATDYLKRGIADFESSSVTPNSYVLLGSIYEENLNDMGKAKTAFQHVVDNYPDHASADRAHLFFKPEDVKLQTLIAQQEENLYDENGKMKMQTSADLRRKYADYANKFPDDKKNTPTYLYKSADMQNKMNSAPSAAQSLERLLEKYPDAKVVPDAYLLLADMYDNQLNKGKEAQQLAKDFLAKYPKHARKKEAEFYNKPEKERLSIRITELEDALYANKKARVDVAKANQLIGRYEYYAETNSKDEKAPEYLYKAGEVARSTNNTRKALQLWEKLYDEYRSYEKAPQALFLQGFIYENDLKNLDKAKEIYKNFLQKYPKDDLVDDVKFSLDNLGKPADEIIKAFEERKKGES